MNASAAKNDLQFGALSNLRGWEAAPSGEPSVTPFLSGPHPGSSSVGPRQQWLRDLTNHVITLVLVIGIPMGLVLSSTSGLPTLADTHAEHEHTMCSQSGFIRLPA
jgi:hypothetical protein